MLRTVIVAALLAASPLITPACAQSNPPAPKAPVATETELIRQAQQLLTEIGQYSGPVDGKMSDATVTAVKRFQNLRGVEPDGKITRLLVNMIDDARKP